MMSPLCQQPASQSIWIAEIGAWGEDSYRQIERHCCVLNKGDGGSLWFGAKLQGGPRVVRARNACCFQYTSKAGQRRGLPIGRYANDNMQLRCQDLVYGQTGLRGKELQDVAPKLAQVELGDLCCCRVVPSPQHICIVQLGRFLYILEKGVERVFGEVIWVHKP
jgi:hypothetical protein